MAGRPSKQLRDLVRDGSFLARRHEQLLAAQDVPWEGLAELQGRYRAAGGAVERRAVAREFEAAVRAAHEQATARAATAADPRPELERELLKLGPHGSAQQARRFFPRFLTLESGAPFRLERWESDVLGELYRRHPAPRAKKGAPAVLGRRVYKEALLGIPRGNGKTPFASGLGVLNLLHSPWLSPEAIPRVFQAAGSKEQAAVGVAFANQWVDDEDSPLGEWLRVKSSLVELRDRTGQYRIASADGRMAHGKKPTLNLLDEWWLMLSERERQVYIAFATAQDKVAESFLLATTTAGYDKTTQLGVKYDEALELEEIEHRRQGFLTIARDVRNGFLMWWYGMPDGYELDLENDKAVLRALKLSNPSSFVDCEALLRALRRPGTDIYEWQRLHLNHWTKVALAWIASGLWDRLAAPKLEIPDNAEIYVAVDAAHTYDTTGVAWAWKPPSGPAVVRAKVFSVRKGLQRDGRADVELASGSFYDPVSDDHVAEQFIHGHLAKRYRIREIVGDPNYFGRELARLGRRYTTAPVYPQSNDMREYVQGFYQDVNAGPDRLVHDGGRVLRAHVTGIAGQKTSDGYWAIRKLKEPNPIDGAIAVIMARGRALVDRQDVSVYARKDLAAVGGAGDEEKRDETAAEREDRAWRKINEDESAFDWPASGELEDDEDDE